jgi:hypothetical protein
MERKARVYLQSRHHQFYHRHGNATFDTNIEYLFNGLTYGSSVFYID